MMSSGDIHLFPELTSIHAGQFSWQVITSDRVSHNPAFVLAGEQRHAATG